jgi:hypothetical protein
MKHACSTTARAMEKRSTTSSAIQAPNVPNAATSARKVTHRFFRVRGDTTEALLFGKKKVKGVEGTPVAKDSDNHISSRDPGVILVHSGAHISLAVAEALSYRLGA